MQSLLPNSELMLGNPVIDSQHERVLESMHELRALIELGRPNEETRRALDEFAGVVARHFSSEAEMMLCSA